jgi:chemotaxis response regulator CheB
MTDEPPRLLLLGDEPMPHTLLGCYLASRFAIRGEPCGHVEALKLARAADVDVVLIDTDLTDTDPVEFVSGIALVCAAPIVVISALARPGSTLASALFRAGARIVSHKPAGRLPLDLDGGFGEALTATLRQVAGR